MAIPFFSDLVRLLSIGRNPIEVLLIRSDPVRSGPRFQSIRSDPIRSGPGFVNTTPGHNYGVSILSSIHFCKTF